MCKSSIIFLFCLFFLLPFELSYGKPFLDLESSEEISWSELPNVSAKKEELFNFIFWEVFVLSEDFIEQTDDALRNVINEIKKINNTNNEYKTHMEKLTKIQDTIEYNDSHYFVFSLTSMINDLLNTYDTAKLIEPTADVVKIAGILQKQNFTQIFEEQMECYLKFEETVKDEIQNFLDSITTAEKQNEQPIIKWFENLQKEKDPVTRSTSFLELIEEIEFKEINDEQPQITDKDKYSYTISDNDDDDLAETTTVDAEKVNDEIPMEKSSWMKSNENKLLRYMLL